jgi:hypothetical protein
VNGWIGVVAMRPTYEPSARQRQPSEYRRAGGAVT